MRGERTRRGDCAGKLYVRVLGGYLIGADDDLRAVDCCVALEEDEAEERLSGRLMNEREMPRRQDHSYLKQEAGNGPGAWWFGSLASPCEAGAACIDPAVCPQCTQQRTYRARPEKTDAEDLLAKDNLLSRIVRPWRKPKQKGSTTNGNGGNGSRAQGANSSSPPPPPPSSSSSSSSLRNGTGTDTQQVETTFCAKEFGLDVDDYFGRLPITFRVWREGTRETVESDRSKRGTTSSKKRDVPYGMYHATENSRTASKSSAAAAAASKAGSNLFGSGTARLADGLTENAFFPLGSNPGHATSSHLQSSSPSPSSPPPPPPPPPLPGSPSLRPLTSSSVLTASLSAVPLSPPSSISSDAKFDLSGGATGSEQRQAKQVVRLASANGQIAGCLLVEIRFIQTRTKDRSAGAALHEAIKNGQVKLVEIIINALRRKSQVKALTWRPPTEDGMNAYELAARHGQTRVLEALLRNTSSSAWSAWTNSSPPKGLTALHMAVLGNSASSAQALLNHARKQELTTSLFDSGGFDYLQELGGSGLERHRSLASHAKNIMLKATDDKGRTPFALACGMELPRNPLLVVFSLSQLGAGIAATDNEGNTPLMAAIFAGQSAVACALLEMTEDGPPGVSISRACPNMPNKEGLRPLHIAARKGDIVVVKALLEAGALSALRSSAGSTPLHLAARHGHLQVAKALIDWPMQFAVTEEEQYLADKQRRARRRLTRNASSRSSDEDLDAEVRAQIEADASLAAAVAAMEEGSYSRFYGFLGQEEESSAASRLRARQRHEAFTAHAMVDDTGSSARFQRLRRAKTRFSRLVGRMRQRRQPVPTSPPTSSSSSLEGGIENEAYTPESSAPATDENSPREPTSGANASAGEENQALGSRERNNSDATFIATDDEEEHEDDEILLGAGAATSSDADHAASEGDSDYFGGVTKIKEEKVKFKGVSRREALAHRDPGVDAVEWSTWLTPAEIAKCEGHADVYNYLHSFLEPETNGSSAEGAGNSVAKQKPEVPAVSSVSKDHDGLPPSHGHVKGIQEATSTPQPQKSAIAPVAADDDDHDDEGMDTFLGPVETEIGTDEYYEYPFLDADSA